MIPKRVTLENFLSFGPRTEVVFADDEPLWVVSGPNGVGKSAVFDAITFCLFGEHRGGAKEVDPLVRHGANGFRVCIEFGFNGADYRVARGRTGTRGVQSVERKDGNGWQRVPDVTSSRDVTAWAVQTLGLGFDAFSASVLLRQGEADKIVSAGGTERLKILKRVIGAERYEVLGKRVHEAARTAAVAKEELAKRRDLSPAVSDDDVRAAAGAQADAEERRAACEQERKAAAEVVGHAKRFDKIEAGRRDLADKQRAAAARATDADAIRRDHARLGELAGVLPTLAKLIPLRDGLPAAERGRDEIAARLAAATTQRADLAKQHEAQKLAAARHRQQAADLAAEITQSRAEAAGLQKDVTNAEQLAGLDTALAAFEPDLDERDVAAAEEGERTAAAERAAQAERTEARALLKQRQAEWAEFAGVESGVTCSRCGQTVGPEHIERERERLDAFIRGLTARVEAADQTALQSTAALGTATELRKRLAERIKRRDTFATRRQAQAALGVSADVTGLRAAVQVRLDAVAAREADRDTDRAKQHAAEAEVERLEAAHAPLVAEVSQLTTRLTTSDQKLAADRATRDTLAGQLPETWAAATAAEFADWSAEAKRLTAAGVADRFRELQQDFAQRDVWQARQAELDRERADIPEQARVSFADAERVAADAATAYQRADAALQTARDTHATLVRQAGQAADVLRQLAAAEATARVHARLDDLLGNAGLQRELVRRAETEIVRYANETVGKLSDGDLTIELAGQADGDTKALDLLVRRADAAQPTPVAYLSGSQKFRVAVAVALGIGRFAVTGARPLDCVIIDEGFGSLDRDGLRAAADELTRLKGCLKRIVVVSHQEEFADRFPAVIRLEKGPDGTTATAIRR